MRRQDAAAKLRLSQLPERTPIKLTISLDPAIHALLNEYASQYNETYGATEPLTELIPFILKGFIGGDKAFARAKRERKLRSAGA